MKTGLFGKMKKWGVISMMLLGVTHAPTALAELSPQAGGSGGTDFTRNCGEGRALIGIKGKSASYVDSIRGICASFDQILAPHDIGQTTVVGGSGGNKDFEFRCPSGEVVVGLFGKAGWFIDKIGITCTRPAFPLQGNDQNLFAGDPLLQNEFVLADDSAHKVNFSSGGTGGDSFDIRCPHNLPARGLKGGSGVYIDRIRLNCETPDLTDIPQDPTLPDLRVVVRGLPFLSKEGDPIDYSVELWNVGGAPIPSGTKVNLTTDAPLAFPSFEFSGALGGCDVHTNFGSGIMTQCEAFDVVNSNPLIQRKLAFAVNVRTLTSVNGDFTFGAVADPSRSNVITTAPTITTTLPKSIQIPKLPFENLLGRLSPSVPESDETNNTDEADIHVLNN